METRTDERRGEERREGGTRRGREVENHARVALYRDYE